MHQSAHMPQRGASDSKFYLPLIAGFQAKFSLGLCIARSPTLLWLISFSLGSTAVMSNPPSKDWRVEIVESGRSGLVNYHEPSGSISFYWEFGGGDAVANISVGDSATWNRRYPWAAERRREILERVARDVVRQKAPKCRKDIDEAHGYIYIR